MEQKRKKAIYKRWWFWVLVVVVLGIIGANMGGSKDKTVTGPAPSSSEKTSSEVVKASTSPVPTESNQEVAITEVGQTITTKNFKLTVESLEKPEGNDFVKPAEGNEFIDVTILIENISKKDYVVSSALMFEAYQDDFSINQNIMALTLNKKVGTLDGELAAGKKLRGRLAYEVPKDWKQLEIKVDLTKLSFSSDGEIDIKLPNK
ncbi:DUF4352 domain-containing protein [Gorillibacterium sp. sgz500922]|uniref:DUF4352 domain-containing protein n=1 Tax=Gorillibacterium sp. sgz500922 TaxID=3446694 RepID=UPI003F681B39